MAQVSGRLSFALVQLYRAPDVAECLITQRQRVQRGPVRGVERQGLFSGRLGLLIAARKAQRTGECGAYARREWIEISSHAGFAQSVIETSLKGQRGRVLFANAGILWSSLNRA